MAISFISYVRCDTLYDLYLSVHVTCSLQLHGHPEDTGSRFFINVVIRGADKSLARLGRKQATATEDLMLIYPIYYLNWRNISTIYVYKTKLASSEIFSPSNKIHREAGRAKNLSAPLYVDQTI